MVDISIVNGIINQLISGGHYLVVGSIGRLNTAHMEVVQLGYNMGIYTAADVFCIIMWMQVEHSSAWTSSLSL